VGAIQASFSLLHLKSSHNMLLNYTNNKIVGSLWTGIRLVLEIQIKECEVK